MDNYLLSTVKNIIPYIEKNIKKDISLDDIASFSNFSKYHLHRLFKSITRRNIIDYVRGRKLSHSVNELLRTDLNIIDIAHEYGYKYEQSYIRAFKREFNITPAKFRRKQIPLTLTDKIDPILIRAINNGIILEPEIIMKPEFHIIGKTYTVNHKENASNYTASRYALEFYHKYHKKIKAVRKPETYIGLSRYKDITDPSSTYITALEVLPGAVIPAGLNYFKIKYNIYAVFKYIGLHNYREITFDTIKKVFFCMLDWSEHNSHYIRIDGFHFESINEEVNKEDYCEVDLYLPIKEKTKIN